MPSTENSNNAQGRVRAETDPLRPSPHLSGNTSQCKRDRWFTSAMTSHCSSSPSEELLSPLKTMFENGLHSGWFLQRKWAHGDGEGALSSRRSCSRIKSTRTSCRPPSCESGGSATSYSEETPCGTPRASRRRHHNPTGEWRKEVRTLPTSRQQRLVTSMLVFIVILGSLQIIGLIAHPWTGQLFALRSLSVAGGRSGAGGGGAGVTDGIGNSDHRRIRRRSSETFQNRYISVSGGAVDGNGGATVQVSAGGLGAGLFEKEIIRQHQQGLSLSNPRAFEMVAADMGHLKDTVEKLDLAIRETMGQQAKDLAAVMDQLGVQTASKQKGMVDNLALNSVEHSNPVSNKPARFHPSTSQIEVDEQEPEVPAGGIIDNRQWSQPSSTEGKNQIKSTSATESLPVSAVLEIENGVGDMGANAVVDEANNESNVSGHVTTAEEVQVGDWQGKEGSVAGQNESAVWNAYQQGKWINGQWVPKVLFDDSSPDLSDLAGSKQRRILLMSEKRSGSQAAGGVLNADPRVFYVADPCRMGGGPEALDSGSCSLAVSRLLACQPTINDIRNMFSFSHIVKRSRVLSEFESLRWQTGATSEENDESVRVAVARQCRLSSVVVVKETRLAEVAPRLSAKEFGVEFLLVVRDPRAAIHSVAKLWDESHNAMERSMAEDCSEMASRVCSLAENKLKSLNGLGKHRFRVLKYEMFVEAPVAMTRSVYSWLHLGEFPQEVVNAVKSVYTRDLSEPPPGTVAWRGAKTTLGRFEWATRWAVEMPTFRQQQVQRACQALLETLSYDKPHSSEKDEEPHSPSSTEELSVFSDTEGHEGSSEGVNSAEAAYSSTVSRGMGSASTIPFTVSVTDTIPGRQISSSSSPMTAVGEQENIIAVANTKLVNGPAYGSAAALRAAVEGGGAPMTIAG